MSDLSVVVVSLSVVYAPTEFDWWPGAFTRTGPTVGSVGCYRACVGGRQPSVVYATRWPFGGREPF